MRDTAAGSELVATIVAAGMELSPAVLKQVTTAIEKSGGASVRTGWLAVGAAADIFCSGKPVAALHGLIAAAIKDQEADILIQHTSTRRKKLLIADMESTIIEQEMLDELADVIGLRDKVAGITRRAMNGELDFAAALKERVMLLKGQPASILDKVAQHITYMPGAAALVATMKAQGAACWLVSGGFTCFVKPVALRLGFDQFHANELIIRDGVLTGEVKEPILDKNSKKLFLEEACEELEISPQEVLAVGDGANDIPMLAACKEGGGLGVAYQAKPNVRAAVPQQINYGDLSALLYAQGYKRDEFRNS